MKAKFRVTGSDEIIPILIQPNQDCLVQHKLLTIYKTSTNCKLAIAIIRYRGANLRPKGPSRFTNTYNSYVQYGNSYVQYGNRKCEARARVFSQALEHGNSSYENKNKTKK